MRIVLFVLLMLSVSLATIPASAQTARIAARSHSASLSATSRDADHFGIIAKPVVKDTVKPVAPATPPAKSTPARKHVRKRTRR